MRIRKRLWEYAMGATILRQRGPELLEHLLE